MTRAQLRTQLEQLILVKLTGAAYDAICDKLLPQIHHPVETEIIVCTHCNGTGDGPQGPRTCKVCKGAHYVEIVKV